MPVGRAGLEPVSISGGLGLVEWAYYIGPDVCIRDDDMQGYLNRFSKMHFDARGFALAGGCPS